MSILVSVIASFVVYVVADRLVPVTSGGGGRGRKGVEGERPRRRTSSKRQEETEHEKVGNEKGGGEGGRFPRR